MSDLRADIAFIGLGNMGIPMATHVCAAGFSLVGFDVAEPARARATAAGVPVSDTLDAATEHAGVIILMLPNSDVVEEVMLGQRVIQRLRHGSIVVDMSSSDPMRTRALAERLARSGVELVDAPVSGGVKGAKAARLTIMAGGETQAVDAVHAVLQTMGSVTRTGPVASGHALKALNNLLSAITMLSSSEAMEAGRRFGLADDVMLRVINASSGRSFSTEFKWPTFMVPETYDSGFGTGLLVKDMRTAVELARQVGLPSRLGEAALELWSDAEQVLGKESDHTEIAKYVARAAGA